MEPSLGLGFFSQNNFMKKVKPSLGLGFFSQHDFVKSGSFLWARVFFTKQFCEKMSIRYLTQNIFHKYVFYENKKYNIKYAIS